MAENIKLLITKRGQLKAKLTRFKSYIESGDTSQLTLRYKDFECLLSAFEDIQSQIEIMDDKQGEGDSERDTFENTYYELASRAVAQLSKINNPCSQPLNSNQQTTHTQIAGSSVKLPSIDLPKFSGNYEDWLPFYDLFNSLVHSNSSISDVEKFHYLKTSLHDKVKPILSSMETSSDNYATAWSLLKERYDNKRIIVNKHISSLVNIEPLGKENANSIRCLLDNINKHTRCLKSLGQPTDSWDSILIFILSKKLDTFTLRHWENQNLTSELPTMKGFLEFLQSRCQVLEAVDSIKFEKQIHPHTSVPSNTKLLTGSNKSFNNNRIGHYSLSHVVTNVSCYLCNTASHHIFKCPRFLAKSAADRLLTVKQLNLCTNCLSKGHTRTTCVSGSCNICAMKHNTLLHMNNRDNATQPQYQSKIISKSNKQCCWLGPSWLTQPKRTYPDNEMVINTIPAKRKLPTPSTTITSQINDTRCSRKLQPKASYYHSACQVTSDVLDHCSRTQEKSSWRNPAITCHNKAKILPDRWKKNSFTQY